MNGGAPMVSPSHGGTTRCSRGVRHGDGDLCGSFGRRLAGRIRQSPTHICFPLFDWTPFPKVKCDAEWMTPSKRMQDVFMSCKLNKISLTAPRKFLNPLSKYKFYNLRWNFELNILSQKLLLPLQTSTDVSKHDTSKGLHIKHFSEVQTELQIKAWHFSRMSTVKCFLKIHVAWIVRTTYSANRPQS